MGLPFDLPLATARGARARLLVTVPKATDALQTARAGKNCESGYGFCREKERTTPSRRRRSDAVLNVSDLVIEPLDPSTSANGRYPFRITPPTGRSRADSAASRGGRNFSIRDSAAALMGGGGRDSAVLEAETEEDAQAWVDAISSWQSAGLLSALL